MRHLAVVADVVGQVDGRHAAGADLALDPVAVGQGGLEPAEELGHGNGLGWGAGRCRGGAGWARVVIRRRRRAPGRGNRVS